VTLLQASAAGQEASQRGFRRGPGPAMRNATTTTAPPAAAPVPGRERPQRARHARGGQAAAIPGAAAPRAREARTRPRAPEILIAGAHGGAGVSTLAALLRLELGTGRLAGSIPRVHALPAIPDADPRRIAANGWLPVPPPGTPLILTARGTAEGARRAVIAVAALGHRGIQAAVIAVIADGAGPEPRQAAQRFDLIAGRGGALIRVPFAAPLRAGTDPAAARLPRRLRAAVADLAELAVPAPGRNW
jgi:hypothetical protein